MNRTVGVVIASCAIVLAGFVAIGGAAAASSTVSASGGAVKFSTTVRNAKTCVWSSRPRIVNFNISVRCKSGQISRTAVFLANNSPQARNYVITLTINGKAKIIEHWILTQAGQAPSTTTTIPPTTTSTITTTTVPPTTTTTLSNVTTVLSTGGSGDESLPQFTIPASARVWIIGWAYNCTNYGYEGNFITNITGYGSAAGTFTLGQNQLGMGGSGADDYYNTGTFSIQVISECTWGVVVEYIS
jgi:hypothetical protein